MTVSPKPTIADAPLFGSAQILTRNFMVTPAPRSKCLVSQPMVALHSAEVIQGISGDSLEQLLQGKRITAACRKGKHLWLTLDSGPAVMFHFGKRRTPQQSFEDCVKSSIDTCTSASLLLLTRELALLSTFC